ncbi:MAG: diaminopimelate epimerase [Candidatus Omnitrophica bacterium]|nr:diaminopimelate epimerase [Candidatus Omnitrophota bacterium]MCM8770357.1 diaminopimelate epimerase [Candidatus Omnitrophota bacterium]
MKKIKFTKTVASGNDFVVIDSKGKGKGIRDLPDLTKKICDRKFGAGADGLLLLEKSRKANIKMRIFNADGSEAEMCGNGARCVAFYCSRKQKPKARNQIKIETKAGIIVSEVNNDNVKIKLTEPKNIKLDIPLGLGGRILKVNFVNTGVPHCVIFVEGLDKIDVVGIGRPIRYHRQFSPQGTNVNFVEVLNKDSLKIRTYERGVEDETLACGTGAVACAVIFALKGKVKDRININTRGGEVLKVYFERTKDRFCNVWLEGKARIVYQGEYYV